MKNTVVTLNERWRCLMGALVICVCIALFGAALLIIGYSGAYTASPEQTRLVGWIICPAFCVISGTLLVLVLKTQRMKTVSILDEINAHSHFKQLRCRRMLTVSARLGVIAFVLVSLVGAALYDSGANQQLGAAFIIASAVLLATGTTALTVWSAIVKKLEIEFYDELFSFAPHTLPEDAKDYYFDVANSLPFKFGRDGITKVDDEEPFADITTPAAELGDAFEEYSEVPSFAQESQKEGFISYTDLRLKAFAFYNNCPTRMTVLIASQMEECPLFISDDSIPAELRNMLRQEDDYVEGKGYAMLGYNCCFVYDGFLHLTLKKYGVQIEGLNEALENRKQKMKAAKKRRATL